MRAYALTQARMHTGSRIQEAILGEHAFRVDENVPALEPTGM